MNVQGGHVTPSLQKCMIWNTWRLGACALGKIGTLLGSAGANILAAQLSQDADGDGATIMLRLDRQVPADVLSAIGRDVNAVTLEVVDLS